jgi:hypothetical protein
MLDVKNEVTIITTSSKFFSLWVAFVTAHSNREFIDPDTEKKFNGIKQFDYGPRVLASS